MPCLLSSGTPYNANLWCSIFDTFERVWRRTGKEEHTWMAWNQDHVAILCKTREIERKRNISLS